MSIEGQGHFFTIYFLGFVYFVLYEAKISGERLQDHWSSGLMKLSKCSKGLSLFSGNLSLWFLTKLHIKSALSTSKTGWNLDFFI